MSRWMVVALSVMVSAGVVLGRHNTARAQRGADFQVREQAPLSRADGFPGLFDSHLARPGEVVVGAPFTNLHVGLTEDLTVGTNLLALSPVLGGNPGGHLELKYRFYARPGMVSTLSAQAGYWDVGNTDASVALLASNTTWPVGDNYLTLSVLAGRLGYSSETVNQGVTFRESADLSGLGIGFGYQRFFSRRFGVRANLITVPAIEGNIDSSTLSVNIAANDAKGLLNRSIARAMLEFRLGDWLLGAGALSFIASPKSPMPWLSATWSI